MTVIAVFADTLNTSLRLRADRATLDARFETQEKALADARKLREQLEAIASDTARLAEQGNQSAIRVRDYLQQQGITIRSQPVE
jgi:hypothetical protein